MGEQSWQPIETAPTDGTRVILMRPAATHLRGGVVIGRHDDDRHANKPRPFWSYEGVQTMDCRRDQPTVWMPLPEPPVKESR